MEATKRTRAKPGYAALLVAAMTAHAMKGHRSRRLGAGMDDYVAGLVALDDLVGVVERWVLGRELGDATVASVRAPPVRRLAVSSVEESLARGRVPRVAAGAVGPFFAQDAPRNLADLHTAEHVRDHTPVRMPAHGSRDGVSNVGGLETAEAGQRRELAADERRSSWHEGLLQAVDGVWGRLVPALGRVGREALGTGHIGIGNARGCGRRTPNPRTTWDLAHRSSSALTNGAQRG